MSDFERNKDQIQAGVQAGASLVGRIAVIITDAVGSIAREVGDFVTDSIEMREAARLARRDAERDKQVDRSGEEADWPIDLDDIEDGELQG